MRYSGGFWRDNQLASNGAHSIATIKIQFEMYAEYNPLAPFSKGEFLKSPLIKGDSGGCYTHHENCCNLRHRGNFWFCGKYVNG